MSPESCAAAETCSPIEQVSSIAIAAAAMIWTWVVLLALIPSVGFLLGAPLGGWMPLVALLAPVAIACVPGALVGDRWTGAVALVVFAGAVLGCLGLAAWFYDTSYDGQWYHQEAVLRLAGGWNPLRAGKLWDGSREHLALLWIDHYPDASWLAGAGLLRLLGSIEAAKAIAPLLLGGTFLTALGALLRLGFGVGRGALVAVAIAANPVAIYQALTFYVDGQLASALGTIVAAAVGFVLAGDRRFLVPLAAAAAWGANLKFTGPVFVVLAAAALLAAVRVHRRPMFRTALVATAVGALVAGVIGIHPYLTNLVGEGHPFHPLLGRRKVDIVTTIAPAGFTERSSLTKFALATFAASDNKVTREPRLKVPLALDKTELRAFAWSDPRYGGFGPWFGGALLLALVGVAILLRARAFGWPIAVLAISGSVLVVPEAWWARYVPQLWLVPVLVSAGLLGQGGRLARYGFALLGVLLVNVALVTQANLSAQLEWTRQIDAELGELAKASAEAPVQVSFGPHAAVRRRLEEESIPYKSVDTLACEAPRALTRSEVRWCGR